MKNLYLFLMILAVPAVLVLMSNSTGSPGGRTGSPGDNGNTCTGCHTGNATSKFGWITSNVPTEGYTPGQTYTFTATGTHTGVVKFGFELTVENSQGDKVGTLQLAEPTRTKFTNGNEAVTHTASGNIPSGNSNSWTVNWVAPSDVEGSTGIYAAFNAANGNGNTSGDVVYKSSIFISEYIPVPALVDVVPDSALQGEIVTVLITAENTSFTESDPVISLSNDGNPFETILATSVNVINDITAEAVFTIPGSASPGLWDLHADALILDKSFTVVLLTAIADNNLSSASIYPNPAHERFFVERLTGAELSLYHSNGAQVLNTKVVNERQEVNISRLTPGLYLIRLELNGINRFEKLLVN